MTTAALIDDLAAQGIALSIDGDKLRVEGPADLLTDDLRATLMTGKAEILVTLGQVWARKAAALHPIAEQLAQLVPRSRSRPRGRSGSR